MRIRHINIVLAFAVTTAACKPAPVTALAKNNVLIDLECLDDGGFTATINPWRAEFPKERGGSVKWTLGKLKKVNEADIQQTTPATWPFTEPSFKARPGNPAEGKNLKPGTVPGTYKYTIRAICYRDGGVQDTVVIDPDMIIPTGFEFE